MSDLMSQRYGGRRPVRRVIISVLVGIIVLAGAVWLAWATYGESTPQVSSSLNGFRIVNAHTATANVGVRLENTSVHGRCVLQALAFDHEVVGELDFAIPRSSSKVFSTTMRMRTVRRATAVTLLGCTTPDQVHPR